jgi:tetratricopeptide (TPR) repeat protein
VTDTANVDENAIVMAFLCDYEADREARGAPAELAEYQARYPGFEAVIAREFEALHAAESSVDATLVQRLQGQRYLPLGEIGRGGMGVILRVRDDRLRRDLAMKLLATARDVGPASGQAGLRRFLDEAHITGQLAHPGIVPVHDLGIDGNGRVFFTMALIEGRDLAGIIGALHAGDREWSLARVLGVLLRVCEAVAFAHSRGVIHRDLKPSNVMVGAFGETYVLDWGLARVLGAPDGRRIQLPEEDRAEPQRTVAGDVVGTPAYMAPEQARGETDEIDARADVYAIGAMLYHLLTGAMPYAASGSGRASSREVLAAVREGPPPAVGSLAKDVAPELVAICDLAMRRSPNDRYESVAALADDLRAFLEVRVVHAYETGAVAELRKWILRNRAVASMAAAVVMALALGLGFSLQQKARADARAADAEASFQVARDATERMLTRVAQHRLVNVPQMEAIRRDLLRDALAMHQDLLTRRRDDPRAQLDVARSYVHVARIQRALGGYGEARDAAERAIASLTAMVRDDDGRRETRVGLADARDALGYILIESGELAGAAVAFGAAVDSLDELLAGSPGDGPLSNRKAQSLHNLATVLSREGKWAESLDTRRRVMALAEARLSAQPDHPEARDFAASAAMNLGLALANLDELPEAERYLRETLKYCEPVDAEHERDGRRRLGLASAWHRLSMVQLRQAKPGDARTSIEAGLATLRALIGDFPRVHEYRRELGASLTQLGKVFGQLDAPGDQVDALLTAVREQTEALRLAPKDALSAELLDGTWRWLVTVLLDTGRHVEAAAQVVAFAAAELAPLPPLDAARLFLQCAAKAAADRGLTDDERRQVVESHTRDAVSALRRAVAAEPGCLAGGEFEALRSRADFQALRAELERR